MWGARAGVAGCCERGRALQAVVRAGAGRWARAHAGLAGVGAAGAQAGAGQVWARGALGVSSRGARRGRAGRTTWVCLCSWWACWLGQLSQFGFW